MRVKSKDNRPVYRQTTKTRTVITTLPSGTPRHIQPTATTYRAVPRSYRPKHRMSRDGRHTWPRRPHLP